MWSRLTRCETPWSPISRSRILMCLPFSANRSEEHTSELQSQSNLVCRLLLEKKKQHRFEIAARHVLADEVHRSVLFADVVQRGDRRMITQSRDRSRFAAHPIEVLPTDAFLLQDGDCHLSVESRVASAIHSLPGSLADQPNDLIATGGKRTGMTDHRRTLRRLQVRGLRPLFAALSA